MDISRTQIGISLIMAGVATLALGLLQWITGAPALVIPVSIGGRNCDDWLATGVLVPPKAYR